MTRNGAVSSTRLTRREVDPRRRTHPAFGLSTPSPLGEGGAKPGVGGFPPPKPCSSVTTRHSRRRLARRRDSERHRQFDSSTWVRSDSASTNSSAFGLSTPSPLGEGGAKRGVRGVPPPKPCSSVTTRHSRRRLARLDDAKLRRQFDSSNSARS